MRAQKPDMIPVKVVRSPGAGAGFVRLLMLGLLFARAPLKGADAAGDYFTDVWTSENGLPDSSVTAIAQTPDAYLWVGTYNGLARFDGVRFVTYDPANTPALLRARVRKLYVDSQGTLWINTYDGSLTTMRQGTFTLERRVTRSSEAELTMVSSSPSNVVFLTSRGGLLRKTLSAPPEQGWEELTPPVRGLGALASEDGAGTLWYRDSNGRLWGVVGNQFEALAETAGLIGQNVNCLATDAGDRLWLGTDQGIAVWDGSRFQNVTPTNGESPVNVTLLTIGADGHIWAVADDRVREAEGRRWLGPSEASWRTVLGNNLGRMGTQADRQGGMWFYNYGRGLLHVGADGRIQELTPKDAFPREQVNCFFEDREGNWWAGLNVGGLVRVREKRFRTIDAGREGVAKAAKSVCVDSNGVVWIGTLGGGLDRWQEGAVTNLTLPGGSGMESVFCICPDAAGRLWISAGDDEGLFVREHGEFRQVLPAIRGVKAILADSAGRVWVGTRSGLLYRDGSPGAEFQAIAAVPKRYVRALAEDESGTLWAGAGNGDLYRVASNTVTTYHPADTRESEAIWSLLADRNGTVWAGTFRGGLLRWRDGHFTRYDKKDGLPDNVICQILDDGLGNLWLGSHQGIFRVTKDALAAYARGVTKSLPCTTYGRYDGLPALECSGDYQPAAWRGPDDRLWFATIKGVVSIQPRALHSNLIPPPVVIEEVLVDGRPQHPVFQPDIGPAHYNNIASRNTGSLEVPPGKRHFEFRYTGLSLVSPDEVRFRYRLEGFETDWVEAGTQRAAQYNFLSPGEYRFHVIACNSDGVWNDTGCTLALSLRPHFYETWWFRVLMAGLLVGAVAAAARQVATRRLRRRMEQLERQQAVERERARIAKDIHDDLGASLTLIAVVGDLARKEKTAERIEKMSATARQAVKSLDEIVWAVNPRNDTLGHLIDYAGQFATDYLRDAGIRCLLDVPEQTPVREVPANVRHNVFLVVKEALQNIVKHAQATEVWLRIHTTGKRLRIVIEDNGRGFDEAPKDAWANGLRNMRQRLTEIGGECRVESRVGAGTAITVELPWPSG